MLNERGSHSHHSNLTNFLDSVTPVVPARHLPRSCIRNLNGLWHPWERETIEYFNLCDLWHSYGEWSAYGAGASIKLDDTETVQQYYAPYLSAIQIFTNARPTVSFRELFCDNFNKECGNETTWAWDDCSSDNYTLQQKGQCHLNNRLGRLYFQYFERSSPYQRAPMVDKINSFAKKFPGLKTLKSIDISPASWMSVAWYPIYHIPTGRSVKDLAACFLTYHTISSSFLDMGFDEEMGITERNEKKRNNIALPPFGLATYKMQGNVWLSDQTGMNKHSLVSLFSAADSWLKQLRVQQHDFTYFTSRRYR